MGGSDDGRAEEAPGQEGVSVLHFLPILFYLQTSCCFASPLPDLLEPCQLPADLAELEVRVLEQSCFPTVPGKPPCPPRPARPPAANIPMFLLEGLTLAKRQGRDRGRWR